MKVSKFLGTIGFVAACLTAGFAQAGVMVSVDAQANSLRDGVALNTGIELVAGQHLTITVDPAQIWSFGPGNSEYEVTADGKAGWGMDATNPDGSTFIGMIGSLVGQIGTGTANAGDFFVIGTNFDGFANASGTLNLFFWDSDAWNNDGAVNAVVSVPEPVSMALFGLGLLALARTRRRV